MSRNSLVSYVAFRAGSVVCPQINTVAGLNTHGMKHSCELEFILIKGQPLKINILPYILYGVLYPLLISVKREMSPSDDFWGPNSKVQKIFFICVVNTIFVILQNYISSHSCPKQISFFYSKKLLVFLYSGVHYINKYWCCYHDKHDFLLNLQFLWQLCAVRRPTLSLRQQNR